jgi:MFS family permease
MDRGILVENKRILPITAAEFIVRSAYQMGKTPLLPLFALTLGASDQYLGLIVSVSTLTGMLLKPWIGALSDFYGRRRWLFFATALFSFMPFVYTFLKTPEQLFGVRIVHGLATAILGPVGLAFVAEQSSDNRAERLGWFSMARTAGYIVGPATAGWLLLYFKAVQIYTLIGLFSCLAFVPLLLLKDTSSHSAKPCQPMSTCVLKAFIASGHSPAVWFAGGLEASMYIALYALKAFLPVYSVQAGISVVLVGVFFAVQEATHLILKPLGGRLGDRVGHLMAIASGMVILGMAVSTIAIVKGNLIMLLWAVALGVSEALIVPSVVALAASQLESSNMGTGMGLIGMLKNAGKVIGPVTAGVLIGWIDFAPTLNVIGLILLIGASGLICYEKLYRDKCRQPSTFSP